MSVKSGSFTIHTGGLCHIENITDKVQETIDDAEMISGIACVTVAGSTASISTMEFEPGLLRDIPEFFENILPSTKAYHHDDTWHDGNGFSHMRSFLLKTSLSIPFNDGKLVLGTWQQIVLVDFDNRSRTRKIMVQMVGE